MDLAGLTSCRDLTPEHADQAMRSVDTMRLLVARLTEIADPEDGAPMVLIIFARLARGDVPWLEGEVTVEVQGNETRTLIDVFREEGWGIKERLVTQARFRVPFEEFERAVQISAKRFAPLKVSMTPNRIVLSTAANAAAPAKPPPVELKDKSVGASSELGMPKEPEPFELPPPSEPDPFEPVARAAEEEARFGAFVDTNEIDDPFLAAAVVSPKTAKRPPGKKNVPEPPPTRPAPLAAIPMPEPTPEPETAGPAKPKPDPAHSRPTVPRMVAIQPEARRTRRKDPRREEDD